MQIAIFVDPTESEFGDAVETAAFVSEYAIGTGDQVILACGPAAALEIGLSVLGHSVSRTVEGGERSASPIVLLPLIRDRESLDDAAPYREPGDEQHGGLSDLIDLGVFAGREEGGIDPFAGRYPVQSFVEVLRARQITTVLGLGSRPDFWQPTLVQLRNSRGGRLLVRPDILPSDLDLDRSTVIRRIAPHDDSLPFSRDEHEDEFSEELTKARRRASFISCFLEELMG